MHREAVALPSAASNLWRVLVPAVLIALGLELAYLGVGNLLLGGGILERKLNREPNELLVTIERPWTVLPGRVHVGRVSIRVQDSTAQFLIDVTNARVQLDLWALFQRKFHVTSVRVERTAFRYRSKIEDSARARARAAYYPPIPGFSDPPIDGPWPKGTGDVWTVQIENVDAGVSELWVQEFRYSGAGHASGSFMLEPRKRLWVERARLTLAPAPVQRGRGEPLLGLVRSELKGSLPERTLVGSGGIDLLRAFEGEGAVAGEVRSLDFLHAYVKDEKLRLSQGVGPVKARVALRAGRLLPGSYAEYATERLGVQRDALELSGDARAQARVDQTEDGPMAALLIEAAQVSATASQREQALQPLRARSARIELFSRTLELGRRWRVARGSVALPELSAPDLRVVNALVGRTPSWQLLGGSAKGSIAAEIDRGGRLTADTRWQLERVRVQLADLGFSTNLRFSTRLEQRHVDKPEGAYEDFRLALSDLAVATKHGRTGRGKLTVTAERVPYEAFAPTRVDARVEAAFDDAEPVLDALGVTRSTLPDALAGVLDLSDLQVTADVHKTRSSTEVLLRQLTTDAVNARGVWRERSGRSDGAIVVTPNIARNARMGIVIRDGESSVEFFVGSDWLARQARAQGFSWQPASVTAPKRAGGGGDG